MPHTSLPTRYGSTPPAGPTAFEKMAATTNISTSVPMISLKFVQLIS